MRDNITHSALSELLSIIRPRQPDLPKDARTLFGTNKQCFVESITGGSYYHVGITVRSSVFTSSDSEIAFACSYDSYSRVVNSK